MNRRELFKRLAGVGVVGTLGVGVAPENSAEKSGYAATERIMATLRRYQRVIPNSEVGMAITVEIHPELPPYPDLSSWSWEGPTIDAWGGRLYRAHGFPAEERARLARDILIDDYLKRLEKRPLTAPKFVFVPAQNSGDPIEHNREIYGYYAEAIEREELLRGGLDTLVRVG